MPESTLLELCKEARAVANRNVCKAYAEASLAAIQYKLADAKVIRQAALDTDNRNIAEIKRLTHAIRSYEGEAKRCVVELDWKAAKELNDKAKGCRDRANRVYGEGVIQNDR